MLTKVLLRFHALILTLLIAQPTPAHSQVGTEPFPIQGMAVAEGVGGLVSVPGSPLPPLPEESVRAAIPIYEAMISAAQLHPDRAMEARGLGYLANLYASIGESSKAEDLFARAEEILKQNSASGGDLAWVYNNRGLVQQQQGRYAEALESFRSASWAVRKGKKELLEPSAVTFQNLATTYHLLGDVENAEAAYTDALEALRRLRQERSRTSLTIRSNLAILYESMGDPVSALEILQELVTQPNLGPELRFVILNNLGQVLRRLEDFQPAIARLEEALTLTQEASPRRVLVLTNLASCYGSARDFDRARQAGEEGLRLAERLYGKNSRYVAGIESSLGTIAFYQGDFEKAEALLIRAKRVLAKVESAQEALVGVTQALALIAEERGQRQQALELSRQALDLGLKNLDRLLAFGSEAQRLAYRSYTSIYDQLANLGDGVLLAEAALATKGAVLESLLTERALISNSSSPEDLKSLERILALKRELMEAIHRGDEDSETLERELEQTQSALTKSTRNLVPKNGLRPKLARVQSVLEPDQVLIEVIRYQKLGTLGEQTAWYGGVIISRDGDPDWVPLGPAKPVEERIFKLVQSLDRQGRPTESVARAAPNVGLLRELHETLWSPLAEAFPKSAQRVLLSPDSALSFVPWAGLLDERGKFLAETWQITQVGSGRDLIQRSPESQAKTLVAFVGSGESLPYAIQEVDQIACKARKHGWQVTTFQETQASEATLFAQSSPRILHLATHGDFLTEDQAKLVESRLQKFPMYRSFLELGNAEETLQAWKQGTIPDSSSDGVLTAEEASGLNLQGTWLTVLSACRTGAGATQRGEGVLGLRRGFALAGTEHLLLSLWAVDDKASAQFMEAFYERLFQAQDLSRAFYEAQVAELVRWRETGRVSLQEAVSLAGAFVLTR